jgi:hypothetical protein
LVDLAIDRSTIRSGRAFAETVTTLRVTPGFRRGIFRASCEKSSRLYQTERGADMIVLGGPVDLDTLRLRSEFLSMPGLTITRPQVARLLGVRLEHARAMLDELEHEGFLVCDEDGDYRRAAVVFARELERPVRNP